MLADHFLSHFLGGSVEGSFKKDNVVGAIRTREHLTPHRVVDTTTCLTVGVKGLVHPADFTVEIIQDLPGFVGNSSTSKGML